MGSTAIILYSCHDATAAGRLRRFLAAFRTPKRLVGRSKGVDGVPIRLIPRLVQDLSAGDGRTAIADIDGFTAPDTFLIVICSPHSAASAWINNQIASFKKQGGTNRILCLIVAGEPNATDTYDQTEAMECFAPSLKYVMGPDGRLSDIRAEPIAADVRPGKDGWHDACLKIAAGIARVGYDELKQRAQRRRMRIAAIAVAALGSVLLITSVLAIASFANLRIAAGRRVEAITARKQAERAFADAERARGIAEIRSFQAKAIVKGQVAALNLVSTGPRSSSGLRLRAVDVLAAIYSQTVKASRSTPRFEDATTLLAVARSLNALRQPTYALEGLDAAAAILERLTSDDPTTTSVVHRLKAQVCVERAAVLLALGRADDADACLARMQGDDSEPIEADDRLAWLSDLLAADVALSRSELGPAAVMYDDLSRRLQGAPADSHRLLALSEVGRTRIAIKQGDVDRAQACLAMLSTVDEAGLSRQGTLHELYGELAVAMDSAENRDAAVSLLQQSLAVAVKYEGSVPVTLVPQLLMLARLVKPEKPALALRYHDEALETLATALDAFFEPDSVERVFATCARLGWLTGTFSSARLAKS